MPFVLLSVGSGANVFFAEGIRQRDGVSALAVALETSC